jgi:hypothetical protein
MSNCTRLDISVWLFTLKTSTPPSPKGAGESVASASFPTVPKPGASSSKSPAAARISKTDRRNAEKLAQS